jgi:NTP pyrophosphatase (non-canonical NTP hydrolase)
MGTMFAIGADKWAGISKLNEEAGEVIQVIGKLMATYGVTAHWEGTDLAERLEDEMGDVLAAIDFVLMHNQSPLSAKKVMERRAEKLALFNKWHDEQRSLETTTRKDL